MALPATRTNQATNPSFETASGPVAVRTNLSSNPSLEINGPGYASNAGTGGAVTTSRGTDGGYVGTGYYRTLWTTANTATGYVENSELSASGITAGQVYTFSAYLRSSVATTLYLRANWWNGTASTGTSQGSNVALSANTWTRVTLVAATAPTATVGVWLDWYSTGTQAVNQTIDLDATLIEKSPTLGTYFDGATAAAGDFTHAWTGTVNASTSTQNGAGVVTAAGTSCAAIQSTQYPNRAGTKTLRLIPTGTNPDSFTGVGGDTGGVRLGMTAGTTYTASVTVSVAGPQTGTVATPRSIIFFYRIGAGSYVPTYSTQAPNVAGSTRISLTFTVPAGATEAFIRLQNGTSAGGGDTWWDDFMLEQAPALDTYFDGASTGGNYTYAWTGTANASTSTKTYYGIWAEQVSGAGAPKVQVTVIGLGGTAVTTQVIRKAGRDTWTVPGWKKRNTLGAETFTDATPPLARPITYTLISNGLTINSITITVASTTGWVQDPLSPGTAMPVATVDGNPAILALAKAALKKMTYGVRYEEETPLGGQYPVVRAGTRAAASGVEVHLNAYTNTVSDALQQLALDTPILLFRGLPSWGSIPALAYLVGDVEEAPHNRDRGGQFTRWVAEGKLAAPVALGPLTGQVTNQMVQDNLVGRTNASVQSTSGTLRNIDVQANPLGLGQ